MSNKTPWLVLCNQECISARTNSVTEIWVANNSAVKAGSDLYCGYIKRACFNVTFRLVNVDKGDLSAVSSDPLGTCFCKLAKPNCTKRIHYVEVYPGDTLIFQLHVLVGLAFGTVPKVVHAIPSNNILQTTRWIYCNSPNLFKETAQLYFILCPLETEWKK